MQRDKERLERLTQAQNEQLRSLNAGLEQAVADRTHEVVAAHDKLKSNFITSIKVFSNLIDLRGGVLAGHSRRVAEIALKIAALLDLPKNDTQDVMLASLLHDIGKIGFSDELLAKSVSRMNMLEVKQNHQHPVGTTDADGHRQSAGRRAHHSRPS